MLNRPPHPARPALHRTVRGPGWRKRRRRSTLSPKGERVLNLNLLLLPQGLEPVSELFEGLGYTQHYEAAKRAGQKSKRK
jgi:hypothetical protein